MFLVVLTQLATTWGGALGESSLAKKTELRLTIGSSDEVRYRCMQFYFYASPRAYKGFQEKQANGFNFGFEDSD